MTSIPKGLTGDITLYARFNDPEYTISVVSSLSAGGSASADVVKAHAGDIVNVSAAANPGYYFDKWTTTNKDFELPDPLSDDFSFVMPDKSISLIANFIVKKITVHFDKGDDAAAGTKSDVALSGKATYTLPSCPFTAPEEMEFWYWDVMGEMHAPGETIDISGLNDGDVLTCTAVWKYKGNRKLSVFALPENGGVVLGGGYYNSGDPVVLQANPAPGYAFKKWTCSTSGNTINGKTSEIVTFDMPGFGDVTVIAQFEPTYPPQDCIIGDANGDGTVNSKDLTRMMKLIAECDDDYDERFDINGDGFFNSKDLVHLMKYLAEN